MDDGDRCSAAVSAASSRRGSAAAAGRIVAELVDESGDWSAFASVPAVVETAVALVSEAAEIDCPPSTVAIALVSDSEVQALNKAWRGVDKPTNVLSFPAAAGARSDDGRAFLGDIVLAAATCTREAVELAILPSHHLQHLVVHGLLHLLGYDHERDEDADAMEALEVALLARAGVPDPYAEPGPRA